VYLAGPHRAEPVARSSFSSRSHHPHLLDTTCLPVVVVMLPQHEDAVGLPRLALLVAAVLVVVVE